MRASISKVRIQFITKCDLGITVRIPSMDLNGRHTSVTGQVKSQNLMLTLRAADETFEKKIN